MAELGGDKTVLFKWTNSMAIGIEIIDSQHKQLINLTNELYRACIQGGDELDTVFKVTMVHMVDYVRFHFGFEQEMLQRVKFPNYSEHKGEHDKFVKEVLAETKNYNEGKVFVPNKFVRYLKDWIISHIAYTDKVYAAYIHEQMKKGLVTENDITG